jgi:Family of unknown function (DUF5808)
VTRENNSQGSHGNRPTLRSLTRLLGLALLGATVVRELRLPKEQRTWHGVVFGKIPYDLRPPTFDRLKAAIWNPRDSRVVVPTALGVGWTVNVAALRTRLSKPSAD